MSANHYLYGHYHLPEASYNCTHLGGLVFAGIPLVFHWMGSQLRLELIPTVLLSAGFGMLFGQFSQRTLAYVAETKYSFDGRISYAVVHGLMIAALLLPIVSSDDSLLFRSVMLFVFVVPAMYFATRKEYKSYQDLLDRIGPRQGAYFRSPLWIRSFSAVILPVIFLDLDKLIPAMCFLFVGATICVPLRSERRFVWPMDWAIVPGVLLAFSGMYLLGF